MADKLEIIIGAKNLTGRAFRAIRTSLTRLASGAKRAFASIGRTAKNALKVAAVAVTAFAVTSIKAASDAEAVESKFKAVFKSLSQDVEAWSKTFGSSVGRASVDIREMLAGVQDLFVPMGIARKEASELSKTIVKLAIDVASFNGKADSDVIQDFKSALVGSSETVRKYGVVLNEANVAQEAVSLGLAKSTKRVSDSAKVQARLSLIVKGTADAQGNAVDTSTEFLNVTKRLKSAFSDLQREVGLQLIKGLELGRSFTELGTRFINFTKKIADSKVIQEWSARAREALKPVEQVVKDLFSGEKELRISAMTKIIDAGTAIAQKFIDFVKPQAKVIGALIGEGITAGIKSKVGGATKEFFEESKVTSPGRAVGSALAKIRGLSPGLALERQLELSKINAGAGVSAFKRFSPTEGGKKMDLSDDTISKLSEGTANAVIAKTQ